MTRKNWRPLIYIMFDFIKLTRVLATFSYAYFSHTSTGINTEKLTLDSLKNLFSYICASANMVEIYKCKYS